MAFGPDKTQPAGTNKRNDLITIEKVIDSLIQIREGDVIKIRVRDIGYAALNYKQEIIDMYKKAGWRYVYFICNYMDEHGPIDLILSNDINHKIPAAGPPQVKKNPVKKFFGCILTIIN